MREVGATVDVRDSIIKAKAPDIIANSRGMEHTPLFRIHLVSNGAR
jgi:hypothetical protein